MTSPVLTALSTLPALIQELFTVGKTTASLGKVRLALNHVFTYTPFVEETMAEEICISQRTPQICSGQGTQLSWSEWSPSPPSSAAAWCTAPDQTAERKADREETALRKGTHAVSLRTCLLTSSLRGNAYCAFLKLYFFNYIFLPCTKLIHYKRKQVTPKGLQFCVCQQ